MKEVLSVAARALGSAVRSWEIRDADGLANVFAALNRECPDALYVPIGPLVRINAKRNTGFALQNRLPSIYPPLRFS
jgi:hypothetical protein